MNVFSDARERTRAMLNRRGYKFSESLPLLDCSEPSRAREAIVGRILALHCVVALSFGWDHKRSEIMSWCNQEKLTDYMTRVESAFLGGAVGLRPAMQWRVDALFALAWACKLTDRSLLEGVPEELVTWFPNILRGAPASEFGTGLDLREEKDLINELDLLYCLASAKTDLHIRGIRENSSSLDLRSVQQRRQALEWLFSTQDWEEIELDT